jgi:hypothetical protein
LITGVFKAGVKLDMKTTFDTPTVLLLGMMAPGTVLGMWTVKARQRGEGIVA